ncbi:MAG: tetratricopeptide repeat protein [Propionicimonas sp.]
MTPSGFNPSRAMDLSGIAAAAKAPPPPVGASYVLDVDEASFESVIQLSVKHPVVIELHSPRANAADLSIALAQLANEAAGKYLLARVNVDAAPQIAAAFGVQAVPTVIAVVGGQLAPLFQGTREKAEVAAVIGQLLQAAAGAGVVGRAEPVSIAADAGPDPRFSAADAALERGDFAGAVAEFDVVLSRTPNDPEARAGRAQAALLARLADAQPAAVLARAAAASEDIEAQMAAADVELAGGDPASAFGRLIDTIRRASGPDREVLRVRLLELFETVDPTDPAVLSARRGLMSALF